MAALQPRGRGGVVPPGRRLPTPSGGVVDPVWGTPNRGAWAGGGIQTQFGADPQMQSVGAAPAADAPRLQPPTPDPRIASLTQALSEQQSSYAEPGPDPQIAELTSRVSQPIAVAPRVADPRIASLLATLEQQAKTPAASAVRAPDFSRQEAQGTEIRGLLSKLARGEGVAPITNIGADPEAAAYRVAKTRAAERARESEAARLGASGLTGGGDFDARLAGIQEATGEDIAGFEAGLAGKRRGEAITNAMQGANLSLSDLDRQTQQELARYNAEFGAEQAGRGRQTASTTQLLNALLAQEGAGADDAFRAAQLGRQTDLSLLSGLQQEGAERRSRADQQRESQRAGRRELLATLTNEQARAQAAAERQQLLAREEAQRRLQEELLQQEVTTGQRRLNATVPGGRSRTGGVSGGFGFGGYR